MSEQRLNITAPFLDAEGYLTLESLDWTLTVSKWLPVLGSGSPEGVVSASQYSLYINTIGTTGSIEYRKMLSDIGGDKTQGWVAV